jgi:hypothetical protein
VAEKHLEEELAPHNLVVCVVTKHPFSQRHRLKGVRCREAFLALFEK